MARRASRAWVPLIALLVCSASVWAQKPGKPVDPPSAPGSGVGRGTPTGRGVRGDGPGGRRGATPARNLTVSVQYTGAGQVDEVHEIVVLLFDKADVSADSQPMAFRRVRTNGGTATFTGVAASPVFVMVVYDDSGRYHGDEGLPPIGAPATLYAKDAKSPPAAVKVEAKSSIKVKFDDAKRWGG